MTPWLLQTNTSQVRAISILEIGHLNVAFRIIFITSTPPYVSFHFSSFLTGAYQMVMSHPHIQTIRDTSYWGIFEAWKNRVVERLNILANKFWTFMDQYPQIKSYLETYADLAARKIEELKRYEAVQMLDEITRLGYDTVRDRVVDIIKEYTQIGKTKFIVWDPIRGEFQIEIHLPLPLKDLQSLPHAKIQSYINTIKSYLEAITPTGDWNMWDTYYTYKPTSDISNWVPPFKGMYNNVNRSVTFKQGAQTAREL